MNGKSTVNLDGGFKHVQGGNYTQTHTDKENVRDRQIYRQRQRQSVTEGERGRQRERDRE